MNTPLAPLLVMLAAPAAGCVIEARSGDEPAGDIAAISARWSMRNMVDGARTSCPAGFDTAALIAQPIDDRGDAVGDPVIDQFDCDDGAGLSDPLVPDVYQVWIEVRSHDLTALYAQSLSQVLDVRQADQRFSADLLNDGGYFQLAWDLVGAASHRPLDCSQVAGLRSLTAISTSVADPHRAYVDRLRCEDHATISGGLLQGSYTVAIGAVSSDASIGPQTSLTDQVISGQNRVTDLGHILISIDGL
jgi:hypothetical protein